MLVQVVRTGVFAIDDTVIVAVVDPAGVGAFAHPSNAILARAAVSVADTKDADAEVTVVESEVDQAVAIRLTLHAVAFVAAVRLGLLHSESSKHACARPGLAMSRMVRHVTTLATWRVVMGLLG